jgi:hypothetical protein
MGDTRQQSTHGLSIVQLGEHLLARLKPVNAKHVVRSPSNSRIGSITCACTLSMISPTVIPSRFSTLTSSNIQLTFDLRLNHRRSTSAGAKQDRTIRMFGAQGFLAKSPSSLNHSTPS